MKKNINFEIKALIAKNNLTQEDVAKSLTKLGVSISATSLNRKINGLNKFTEDEIAAISIFFNKSPVDIFFADNVDKWTTKTA